MNGLSELYNFVKYNPLHINAFIQVTENMYVDAK